MSPAKGPSIKQVVKSMQLKKIDFSSKDNNKATRKTSVPIGRLLGEFDSLVSGCQAYIRAQNRKEKQKCSF